MPNQDEICRICRKPMVSIFGTGRSKWCPDCEKDDGDPMERTIKIDLADYPEEADSVLGPDYDGTFVMKEPKKKI